MAEALPHKLTLNERSRLTMTGATQVLSFDSTCVVVHTTLGTMVIQGKDLKLENLCQEGGQIGVTGTVDAISYEQPRSEGSWLRRLLG